MLPRRIVLAAVLLLVFPAAGAAARTSRQPLFEFGRSGGNIQPFRVRILSDGTLDSQGPVKLANPAKQLSQARLAALLTYARAQHFWKLPPRTTCPGSLPDFASFFVTIHSAGRTRTVSVRGGCSARFTRIYRALASAATVTS